jgi:hypothetical protein
VAQPPGELPILNLADHHRFDPLHTAAKRVTGAPGPNGQVPPEIPLS